MEDGKRGLRSDYPQASQGTAQTAAEHAAVIQQFRHRFNIIAQAADIYAAHPSDSAAINAFCAIIAVSTTRATVVPPGRAEHPDRSVNGGKVGTEHPELRRLRYVFLPAVSVTSSSRNALSVMRIMLLHAKNWNWTSHGRC